MARTPSYTVNGTEYAGGNGELAKSQLLKREAYKKILGSKTNFVCFKTLHSGSSPVIMKT
jgi:hypothetical protein